VLGRDLLPPCEAVDDLVPGRDARLAAPPAEIDPAAVPGRREVEQAMLQATGGKPDPPPGDLGADLLFQRVDREGERRAVGPPLLVVGVVGSKTASPQSASRTWSFSWCCRASSAAAEIAIRASSSAGISAFASATVNGFRVMSQR
jgi:hypothetical protein